MSLLRRMLVLAVSLAVVGVVLVAAGPPIWERLLAPAANVFESSVDLEGAQAEAKRAYEHAGGTADLVPITREQYESARNRLGTPSSLAPGEVPFYLADASAPRIVTMQKNPDGSWGRGISVPAGDWRP